MSLGRFGWRMPGFWEIRMADAGLLASPIDAVRRCCLAGQLYPFYAVGDGVP